MVWLYYNGMPLTAVRVSEDADLEEVYGKALMEAYITCNYPLESPRQRKAKILQSEARWF